MKTIQARLWAALTLAAMAVSGLSLQAQTPGGANPQPQPAQAQPQRPRIALVNIARVLKEFNKAHSDGQAINTRRQQYVDSVKPMRDRLAQISKQIAATNDEAMRTKLREEALKLNRQIEDIDRQAQEELTRLSDKVIVEVYKMIKGTINDIAGANNLDLVLCYPDASDPKDEDKPLVAQLKLQTPALMPFYHKGMDITEYVIKTLNYRYPAAAVPASAPGANAKPMGGGVTPVGGTQPRP